MTIRIVNSTMSLIAFIALNAMSSRSLSLATQEVRSLPFYICYFSGAQCHVAHPLRWNKLKS